MYLMAEALMYFCCGMACEGLQAEHENPYTWFCQRRLELLLDQVQRSWSQGPGPMVPGPWSNGPGPWSPGPEPWSNGPGPSALDPWPRALGPVQWSRVLGPGPGPGPWALVQWSQGPGPWSNGPGPWAHPDVAISGLFLPRSSHIGIILTPGQPYRDYSGPAIP